MWGVKTDCAEMLCTNDIGGCPQSQAELNAVISGSAGSRGDSGWCIAPW